MPRMEKKTLSLFNRKNPDFVILDIRMPKLDGLDVLKIMRNKESLKKFR
ncbi:MAG: hypothetical protein UV01_C0004G0030 [Parcubacteria group bacterium GW2011_GWA2_42_14]|nr:MAG: hypothetical protein UV01_C0004G0030 [Parcubacteria group bacterium GW2011_GWA2_42_14]